MRRSRILGTLLGLRGGVNIVKNISGASIEYTLGSNGQ